MVSRLMWKMQGRDFRFAAGHEDVVQAGADLLANSLRYLITSSARMSTDWGILRPRALAVFKSLQRGISALPLWSERRNG